MGITIGIDLGTTNSVVGLKKITITTLRNAEGHELTPSVVTAVPTADQSGFDLVVGAPARDLLKQYPEQTITSVKRLMGREFEDTEVQSLIKEYRASYPILTEASEPGSIRIPLGGKMHTPEMVSGLILSKLIRDGEAQLQGKIAQAVVTVPAYFSDRQKFATRAACDYAGIKLLRLLPEPTAAALSFGLGELGPDESRTIMVFDLGGGTFDISVLSFVGGSFMEITKGGDMWLGGDNIDKLLVEHVFAEVEQTAQSKPLAELIELLSPADKSRFLVEIKEKAEAAKITLSTEESASIEMFGLLRDADKQLIDIDVTITRAKFAELLRPIVQRVVKLAQQILHEIRFEPELIDTVLLVGGSSLVPAIQEALKNFFGPEKVMIHPRPMLAIAEGAAFMAAKMASQALESAEHSFAMMHTTAHDYYLQLAGGKRHLLVARNTPLPVTVEETLSFAHEEQVLARLRVFNAVEGVLDTVGELWFHKDDDATATTNLSKPQKNNELMLSFTVDEDNIITMKAWSRHNEQHKVEAQIARGGLSAKLYNDLEHTLSTIVAHCDDVSTETDVLRLSRAVVTTILAASDPLTGETRTEYKQRAQQQINTLRQLQQQDIAPVSLYEFGLMAQSQTQNIFAEADKLRLNTLLERGQLALDNLTDIAELLNFEKELTEFYRDFPLAADLARAENAAEVIGVKYPLDAQKIRKQSKKLADAYLQHDNSLLINARDELYYLIDTNVSWSNTPSRRFDRDVRL